MRLLVISNNPERASFRQRIGIYLDLLRDRGIESEVARLPVGLLGRRKVYASARHFDGVVLHRKMLNVWDGFWLRRCAGPVIYDFDDAIMYSDRKPDRVSRVRHHRFGRSAALSHTVIAGNEYLAEHARRYNSNVHVLPTGLDVGAYDVKPQKQNDGKVRLVWIGSRSTLKYLRDIVPALEELGARTDNVILRIICDEFFELKSMKVEKRPWSRETEAIDLATSDIGLAPLPDNAFTRGKCGFKILQYYAAGLPVVTSPIGVNSEYVCEGVTGFLAREPRQWIDQLSVLAQNPELRRRLGSAGHGHVEEFDRKVIGRRFCELIVTSLRCCNG